ncbi:MAG: hypothetical protein M3O22_09000, partial [Pseudomonadota bacterium]|nr:hypothetical protein [Pseudomonadota bacterium]
DMTLEAGMEIQEQTAKSRKQTHRSFAEFVGFILVDLFVSLGKKSHMVMALVSAMNDTEAHVELWATTLKKARLTPRAMVEALANAGTMADEMGAPHLAAKASGMLEICLAGISIHEKERCLADVMDGIDFVNHGYLIRKEGSFCGALVRHFLDVKYELYTPESRTEFFRDLSLRMKTREYRSFMTAEWATSLQELANPENICVQAREVYRKAPKNHPLESTARRVFAETASGWLEAELKRSATPSP